VTRGYGVLESVLARQRAKIANKLISRGPHFEKILDIGCGTYPFFLFSSDVPVKYGLDRSIHDDVVSKAYEEKIILRSFDIEQEDSIPFDDAFFDVVTMLAVLEHISPELISGRIREIHRILKPGGVCIMTTPAAWTDTLLRCMAALRMVSPVEIQEHKAAYTHDTIRIVLEAGGFKKENISCGYFEVFMNIWVLALKDPAGIMRP